MDKPVVPAEKSQTISELDERLSTERWLLSVGLVPESVQENLVSFGYLASDRVFDVEVDLDLANKAVAYRLFMSPKNLKAHAKYAAKLVEYGGATSLWGKFMYLRLLKKKIKMDIQGNLNKFVASYLPGFKVTMETSIRA